MYTGSKGLFVVLEGIDGSGKTTVASILVKKLEKLGYNVAYTYEPTDSEVVVLMKTKYKDLRDPYVDALTFALDRLLHVKTTIKPLLERGHIVISDRYFYSSVAYQSACGAPLEWVLEVNMWALKPDVAVYLDIEPELALRRKFGTSSRFPEFEEVSLLRRVREAYLELVRRGLLVKVNASRSVEEVYSDVENIILKALKLKVTS